VALPDFLSLGFSKELPRGSPRERFIVGVAEDSVKEVTKELWETLIELFERNLVARPNVSFSQKHLNEFKLGIPANEPRCLGDIINAGWLYVREKATDFEGRLSKLNELDQLNDMLLKTIEVLEFRRRTQNDSKRQETLRGN
jgi:hypothetical protein